MPPTVNSSAQPLESREAVPKTIASSRIWPELPEYIRRTILALVGSKN
jgi:hypothetical protein